jgi:hypothetical protein
MHVVRRYCTVGNLPHFFGRDVHFLSAGKRRIRRCISSANGIGCSVNAHIWALVALEFLIGCGTSSSLIRRYWIIPKPHAVSCLCIEVRFLHLDIVDRSADYLLLYLSAAICLNW